MLIDNGTPQIEDDNNSRLDQRKWTLCLLPVVHAAKAPEVPQRPPKMKYKELPIYTTPHHDYKDYLEDKWKCPRRYDKLMHNKIVPHIKSYRQYLCKNAKDFCDESKSMKNDVVAAITKQITQFKGHMRHPDNMPQRIAVVSAGSVIGYCFAAKRGLPSRIFFTSLGLLSTGSLCFPKETDVHFREVSFALANILVKALSLFCGINISFRTQVPCKSGELPLQRLKNKCPQWPFDKEYTKKPGDWTVSRKW